MPSYLLLEGSTVLCYGSRFELIKKKLFCVEIDYIYKCSILEFYIIVS